MNKIIGNIYFSYQYPVQLPTYQDTYKTAWNSDTMKNQTALNSALHSIRLLGRFKQKIIVE